jgi:hypothetical protein
MILILFIGITTLLLWSPPKQNTQDILQPAHCLSKQLHHQCGRPSTLPITHVRHCQLQLLYNLLHLSNVSVQFGDFDKITPANAHASANYKIPCSISLLFWRWKFCVSYFLPQPSMLCEVSLWSIQVWLRPLLEIYIMHPDLWQR